MEERVNEKRVDARGEPCPQPVILTRDAIDAVRVGEGGVEKVRIVVDNEIAAQNVERMAKSQGWEATTERDGADIHVVLTKGEGEPDVVPRDGAARAPKVVVFIVSNLFGVGDEKLGEILMRAFVKTIKDIEPRPAQLIFANSGVRLTTEGSGLIDDLRALEESGVEVISCGTCLDYYRLVEKLRVGRASNMYEIASALVGADRIVRP
jgi:selenium metabolism protein YedF